MWKLRHLVRGCQYCNTSLKITPRSSASFIRRCTSIAQTTRAKTPGRKWRIILPTGIGLSVVAGTQWNYLHEHGYSIDVDDKPELINDVVATCYCCLPLRVTSRIWGWLTSINLPENLRPALYKFYANLFNANLDEIELDLSAFPNLMEFFVRTLKNNARPISKHTSLISPADGEILYFGPVMSCRVEQVKGATYDLRQFLGDLNGHSLKETEEKDDYVNSLLKNPKNRLYQLVVYLAPGDYHRFHSPTDWHINFRRHFPGKLLSVHPKVLKHVFNLFSLNERVVYVGEWSGGFMAYAAVGATNVGSIRVYRDKELVTNKMQWPEGTRWKEADLNTRVAKGELFGEFRLGSTIVLLFEAPSDFQFCLQVGQTIKVGQALSAYCNKPYEQQIERRHLIMNVAHDWRDIWRPRVA
ncbi:phosphatidylserine decarboxylase proenzyme, mitochondrial [Pseudomyrmex gracilis]|uniref:phosphatidylserine decarboxylase proenzyme, mitochondrial n=1 Tax=Pseudomyrmex gracilis TaxID=219809 RepID=UPI0009952F42|nr:phosphatidylserine decarboxylase proenzyme, mitochondrial [Pseudomyrmex gracilis]